MRIYLASSWRNEYQPEVLKCLRQLGHEVYDFRDADGFNWQDIDPNFRHWVTDVPKYIEALNHPSAIRGFDRDMNALRTCEVCIMLMPCGPSASMEMGWAVGAGKAVAVYIPGTREPDLMVKMADIVTHEWDDVVRWLMSLEFTPSLVTEGLLSAVAQ